MVTLFECSVLFGTHECNRVHVARFKNARLSRFRLNQKPKGTDNFLQGLKNTPSGTTEIKSTVP